MQRIDVTKQERVGIRKPTNLSLDADLVADARDLGINLSRACEDALRKEIAAERARRWQEENKEAIAAWNIWAENNELPLDKYRQF
ncbi:type II toxin-antitoxin system CcdA family antitoxin [Sphingobium sp. BYY-5]|uniref:type II toxin-antitoxin system CcdA family antitoxin n=1 Tax=Sphingobium sp. BYY-5 TaxID=2926400 RepID=UPI001FA6BFE6|nr:type II toxin-antitoxin system CcdA family antitoxin [Sphingobium sp. BYY-5]MCI4589666.1 type II toxin-antitoxin system CcdA family antitoxin [Sphingobium sp. BYY-5]